MADNKNIDRKDVEAPMLGDDLKKATGAEYETLEQLREARKKLSFWQKLKLTWQGKTKVGKTVGIVLDVAELIAPSWAVKTRDIIQSQTNKKPMLQKVLSVKNFINFKDEQGNFDWQELLASVLQLALAGAAVWGAQELGIWNELSQILEQ